MRQKSHVLEHYQARKVERGSAMVAPKCSRRDYPWRKLTRETRNLKLKIKMKESKEKEGGRAGHSRRRRVTVCPKHEVKSQKVK